MLEVAPAVHHGDRGGRIRSRRSECAAALAEIHTTVPAYLAGPETLRAFGARPQIHRCMFLSTARVRSPRSLEARVKRRSIALRASSGLARGDGSARKYAVCQDPFGLGLLVLECSRKTRALSSHHTGPGSRHSGGFPGQLRPGRWPRYDVAVFLLREMSPRSSS